MITYTYVPFLSCLFLSFTFTLYIVPRRRLSKVNRTWSCSVGAPASVFLSKATTVFHFSSFAVLHSLTLTDAGRNSNLSPSDSLSLFIMSALAVYNGTHPKLVLAFDVSGTTHSMISYWYEYLDPFTGS